jgi:hypothetical protein
MSINSKQISVFMEIIEGLSYFKFKEVEMRTLQTRQFSNGTKELQATIASIIHNFKGIKMMTYGLCLKKDKLVCKIEFSHSTKLSLSLSLRQHYHFMQRIIYSSSSSPCVPASRDLESDAEVVCMHIY